MSTEWAQTVPGSVLFTLLSSEKGNSDTASAQWDGHVGVNQPKGSPKGPCGGFIRHLRPTGAVTVCFPFTNLHEAFHHG